jgi:futalosine hydrolase
MFILLCLFLSADSVYQMKILIAAATVFEIRPFLGKLVHLGVENDCIYHCRLKDTSIDVLISGIGMVQTAYCLGKQLAGNRYDLAINAGIGGSYNKGLKIGEVVQVTEECMTELGAEDGENFLSVFDLGLVDPDTQPFTHGRLINNNLVDISAISRLKRVKGATANTIHGNPESIEKVLDHYQSEEESMEGAACFYAFLSEKIPFAEIRAISNYVEERDKTRWDLKLALKNLNHVVEDIFTEICI